MNPRLAQFCRTLGRGVCDRLPARKGKRLILLAALNALMAEYLRDLWEVLRDDPRLHFRKVLSPQFSAADQARTRCLLPCPEIHSRLANVRHWDLVIMPDHSYDALCTPWRFPVLRIPHGIGSKVFDGKDYQYGPRLYDAQGRLKYSRIFECSEARRAHFVRCNPDLAPIISVVGNLRSDRLLEGSTHRDELRRQMGFKPEQTVVLITGSWGADNLFRKVGPELMAEARALMGKYQVVVRLHPNLFGPLSADREKWFLFVEEQKRAGFRISPSEEDMMLPMVACDVMVSDDVTAMTLYAALLQKPLVCVRTGSKQSPTDSFLGRLARMVPELKRAQDLDATVALALRSWPPPGLAELAGEMNSYPGQARERIRTEVYNLLKLPRLDKSNAATGA